MPIGRQNLEHLHNNSSCHGTSDVFLPPGDPATSQPMLDDSVSVGHPILGCPDNIIRYIFDLMVDKWGFGSPKQSVWLSSVCSWWRAIAVDTPRLWNTIHMYLRDPPESHDFLRSSIIPRIKHTLTNVTIWTVDNDSIPSLSMCGLQEIPAIQTLTISVYTPGDALLLLGAGFTPPIGTMRCLRLSSESSGGNTEANSDGPKMDLMSLVARFPPFTKLSVRRLPNIIFSAGFNNCSITVINFLDVGMFDIAGVLTCLPNVRSMTIRRATVAAEGVQDGVTFPSVKRIELQNTKGESWMRNLTFSKLEDLEYSIVPNELFLNFISRHSSITKLGCLVWGDMITPLAKAAPQLEDLMIVSPITSMYSPLDGSSHLPFPRLKFLTIIAGSPPANLTLEDFDALVRARFLPAYHPQSLVKRLSELIPHLVVQRIDLDVPPEWHASELYKQSSRTRSTQYNGFEDAHLAWM